MVLLIYITTDMAYADTLPSSVIRLCRAFNACSLVFVMIVCLDVFVLPRSSHTEKILAREVHYVMARTRYSNTPHKTYLDNVILITENFRYPYLFDPNEGDSARLVTTRIFGIVETGYLRPGGIEEELKHGAGIFGSLKFIPIAFGLIAAFGVAMRRNKEQLLNAAVVNALIIIVQLFMEGYIPDLLAMI
ncbi:hypothetical protein [Pontibacter chitinilyticus]|uniref:hypothetical protein n=1 Tax=Pontibacter chitinilyticus TaxID=2674989 RepID=UPI00321A2F97